MAGGRFQRNVIRWLPSYMRGTWSRTFWESVGAHLDEHAQRAFDGQRSAIPYAGGAETIDGIPLECNADALPWHARDRGITLYPTEPEVSKRVRLSQFRQLKKRKGSPFGVIENVRPYFLGIGTGIIPRMRIVHQIGDGSACDWYTVNSDNTREVLRVTPTNFDFDGRAERWSRWAAFIYMNGTGIAGPPLYGDGHLYGDGTLYGVGGLSAAAQADLANMITSWGAAHAVCIMVALVWGASAVDPSTTPTQDADGRWSLPNGANTWSVLADPSTGLATRPHDVQWIYDNPSA